MRATVIFIDMARNLSARLTAARTPTPKGRAVESLLSRLCRRLFSPLRLLRFTLLAHRLTFRDIFLFAASLALSQNLDASVINDGFCALNF